MSNNRFILTLENLQEVAPDFAAHVDKKTIGRLRQTSKKMNQLFKTPSEIAKLLQFVQEANYEEARKIVTANPTLMFKTVSYKKADGSYESISPLKLAFKLLDTYMWNMFFEIILGNQCYLLDELPDNFEKYKGCLVLVSGQLYTVNADGKALLAPIKNPELLNRFINQLDEQKKIINLEDLFSAYEDFKNQYSDSRFRTRTFINNAWKKIGLAQREVLPRHMLKEFCQDSHLLNIEAPFDVMINPCPSDATMINQQTKKAVPILFKPNQGLGFNFSLIKFPKPTACGIADGMVAGALNPNADSKFFRDLYEIRREDLKKLRTQLAPSTENKPKKGV